MRFLGEKLLSVKTLKLLKYREMEFTDLYLFSVLCELLLITFIYEGFVVKVLHEYWDYSTVFF